MRWYRSIGQSQKEIVVIFSIPIQTFAILNYIFYAIKINKLSAETNL